MRKVLVSVSVGLVLAVLAGVCLQVRRVESQLSALRKETATAGDIAFTVHTLDTSHSVNHALFEPIATS